MKPEPKDKSESHKWLVDPSGHLVQVRAYTRVKAGWRLATADDICPKPKAAPVSPVLSKAVDKAPVKS